MAPADKLQTGPTTDGLAPGWSLEGGPHYHPSDEKHEHDEQQGNEPSKEGKQPP